MTFLSEWLNRSKAGKGAAILIVSLSLFSCSTLKRIDCPSKKYVEVTFILPDSSTYSVMMPYCDSVRLRTKQIPESLKPSMNE